ncbi:hypothetical protein RvY_00710 [Ramazzottius varieornatus]|uniref:EF-hand domain-containing protein n=1 Tax=Ramazzottius varieornatus TaxID=947166 RepID=A0A1D1UDQ4_RAMVA|nr:hypothetical protein RvY_00710 [Ramazzottius varieornatus]
MTTANCTLLRLIDESGKRLDNLSAYDFYTAWQKYDVDGSGFIENTELEGFLKEYLFNIAGLSNQESITSQGCRELADAFLTKHDRDKDGKISISELSAILPTDQTFLLIFRFDNPLDSSEDFMKKWKKYDTDKSGYIEAGELTGFLKDVMKNKLNDAKVDEYCNSILEIFDANKDGKLSLGEALQLLPVKENFLRTAKKTTNLSSLDAGQIQKLFVQYDRDGDGEITAAELDGLCTDIVRMTKKNFDHSDVETLKDTILKGCDIDNNGKIDAKEMLMIIQTIAKG